MITISNYSFTREFSVGKISGKANGLEDVGLLTQDFESSLIKEIHLDGAVIASRNVLPGAIKESHLGLKNIQIDRLIRY